MSMQTIVNGLLLGGLYAAVGLGFSLVWGVMNVINIAHGAIIMLGAYTSYWLFRLYGIDPFLTLPASMLLLFALGYVIQRYIINSVVKTGIFMTLIITWGLNLMLVNLALLLWKGDYRSVTTLYAGTGFQIGGVIVPYIRVGVVVLALALTLALQLFLTRTRTGNAIIATALNKEAAQLVGVNIGHIYAITYGIGAALAAAAGTLMSSVFVITPVMGDPFIGKAFVVAILGGLGTATGAVVGGLVLGLAETIGGAVIGPSYQEAISFIVLVLVLVIRPQGIIGRKFFG
ncbi:MAG TPA: branched-chain amino acid ABC transporter permease [Anaerolineae bacterium]